MPFSFRVILGCGPMCLVHTCCYALHISGQECRMGQRATKNNASPADSLHVYMMADAVGLARVEMQTAASQPGYAMTNSGGRIAVRFCSSGEGDQCCCMMPFSHNGDADMFRQGKLDVFESAEELGECKGFLHRQVSPFKGLMFVSSSTLCLNIHTCRQCPDAG